MALEIEGTIRQLLPVQQGTSARGPWAKQEFVLEFPDGNYTAQACFTAWGQDKVQDLAKYAAGDKVKVSFNLKSREYGGRWYNDLQIWRLAPAGAPVPVAGAPAAASASAPAFASAASAFAPASAPVAPAVAPASTSAFDAPAPTLNDMPPEDLSEDDLPF